jgi:hypothetical protein
MKLTLRDLFWLILVAAMATGWLIDRSAAHSARLKLESKLDSVAHCAGVFLDVLEEQGYTVDWRFGMTIRAPNGEYVMQNSSFFGMEEIRANTHAFAKEEF